MSPEAEKLLDNALSTFVSMSGHASTIARKELIAHIESLEANDRRYKRLIAGGFVNAEADAAIDATLAQPKGQPE